MTELYVRSIPLQAWRLAGAMLDDVACRLAYDLRKGGYYVALVRVREVKTWR